MLPATLEIKVITARVVQRTGLELLYPVVKPTGISAMRPRGGVRARVERVTPAHG